jgi:hypothetical protein
MRKMGDCIYCGGEAGFLRRRHEECEQRYEAATAELLKLFVQAMDGPLDGAHFKALVEDVARTGYLAGAAFREVVVNGLTAALEKVLDDHVITKDENERIEVLAREFGVSADDLAPDVQLRFVKANVLRDIDEGRMPSRVVVEGLPIPNLGRGEGIVWAFNPATLFVTRSRTKYVGGSRGVSVRLSKSVYYKVGASKGEPVRTDFLSQEGVGCLFITNRNVIFLGPGKGIKLSFRKILSVQLYSDGIEMLRDGVNAKPVVVTIDDPPFAANLIARLSQL